jgi:hypothetical protein
MIPRTTKHIQTACFRKHVYSKRESANFAVEEAGARSTPENARDSAENAGVSHVPMSLPYRDRLRLAWELTWPMALIDLAFVLLLHGILETQGETADSVWALVSFFTVSPWVVRRGLNLRYGVWKFEVVRTGVRGPRLGYQESLKVMWLLAWRTLALSLASLLVLSLVLWAARIGHHFDTNDALWNNLGLSATDAVSSLLFTPFLLPGMLRKRYRGFHLELAKQAVSGPGTRRQKKL